MLQLASTTLLSRTIQCNLHHAAHDKTTNTQVDHLGNVYTGTANGVEVFTATGERLGDILAGGVANFAFVGNELYMLGENIITVVKLRVHGAQLP